MSVDESVENLKITVEAFERLRVGLRPFVEETVTQELPRLTLADLRELSRDNYLPEMPHTFAGMDISAILSLMGTQGDPLVAFKRAFGRRVGDKLIWSHKVLKDYRNQAAHHNGLSDQQLTLNQVRDVLATAATWLEAIADRYPEAKEQLAKLEAMQTGTMLTTTAPIPETMADYYAINPDFRDAVDFQSAVRRFVASNKSLDLADSSNPGDADLYFNRGLFYYDHEQYEQAIREFDQALALNPQDANTYFCRGLPYFDLRQYESTIADFDQAIALNPEHTDAHFHRGLSYFYLERYEQAIADFDRVIAINSRHADAYFHRGLSCFFLERYEQAIADFDQAIAIDPLEPDTCPLAWMSAKGDEVFTYNPQEAEAYKIRGLAHVHLEQYEQAIEDYTKAIGIHPEYEAYHNRGLCYAELCQFDQAAADFSQTIALNPQQSAAYINRGRCYTELHQYAAAVADFTTATNFGPSAQIHQFRGEAYEAWGNESPLDDKNQLFDQALADYEAADQLREAE